MKKIALPAVLLCLGFGLVGCPVYDSNEGSCSSDYDCGPGYLCQERGGTCIADRGEIPGACRAPSDCGTNETCSRLGTCVTGDCHFASVGCVRGYECKIVSQRWQCASFGAPGSGGADGVGGAGAGGGDADAGGAAPVSGGQPNGGAPEAPNSGGIGGE